MKQSMKSFLGKLSTRKWMFAFAIYIAMYLADLLGGYFQEAEQARQYGGDFGGGFGYWDIYREYYQTFIPWLLLSAFIPWLILSAYFFDFKNEMHSGWRRVYISAQIIIPTLMALFFVFTTDYDSIFWKIDIFLVSFGWTEVVVLILIKLHIWIKEGFAAKQAD